MVTQKSIWSELIFLLEKSEEKLYHEKENLISNINQLFLSFSRRRYEDICPSTHNMDVPHVKREDYQLTDIDEDFLVLMGDGGDLREDLKIPEGDLGAQLKKEFEEGKELLVRKALLIYISTMYLKLRF